MKKLSIIVGLIALTGLLQSGMKYHFVPPAGDTGATGAYCNSCHTGNSINTSGGNIVATGLPSSTGYGLGQSYPFSIVITHGATDRLRWGFSIAARNSLGNAVGTFSTTNSLAAVNSNTSATDQELSHFNTVVGAASNTFTFNNLTWTAPATSDGVVTFYYVGNATNGNGSTSGDFIYSGSTVVAALPIDLKDFTASVLSDNAVSLKWETVLEQNSDYFEIEKSDDNQFFYGVAKVNAAGNSSVDKLYSYIDRSVSNYNKPVFYRLKLMDKDGKYKLSKIVTVQLKSRQLHVQNLYPTLVHSKSWVTANIASDKIQQIRIDVIDISGRLLQTHHETLLQGTNMIDMQLPASLPSEWVFVRFTNAGFKQTIPLVVSQR